MKDAEETVRCCELTQFSQRCMPGVTGLVSCYSPKNGHFTSCNCVIPVVLRSIDRLFLSTCNMLGVGDTKCSKILLFSKNS